MLNRKIFQILLVIISLIAVITGFLGMLSGITDEFYELNFNKSSGNIFLDTNLRYFSGLWLGLGITLLWIVPSVEKPSQVTGLRIVSLMIFLGGIGRLISMTCYGTPSILFIIFTFMELLFPLLIIWQNKISKSYIQQVEVNS